jgi:hypothetical protein
MEPSQILNISRPDIEDFPFFPSVQLLSQRELELLGIHPEGKLLSETELLLDRQSSPGPE